MERNIHLNWQALVEEAIRRRKEKRMTQEELAILCDISKPTLNHFEQGKTNITLANALKILYMLGLT